MSMLISYCLWVLFAFFFFFKQKTAYEMRISDWSSDVCSSDLLSDHFASFGSRIMSATAGEHPYVLDGLVLGAGALPLHDHYTDTGGATDHVFALCHLLGFRVVPRLRDIADRKLGSIAAPSTYKGIESLMGRTIKTAAIEADWDDIVRIVASIKEGAVAPSAILRKLAAYKRQNRLDFALAELGRIERTLFALDWLEQPDLRHACQAGLNKGERESVV